MMEWIAGWIWIIGLVLLALIILGVLIMIAISLNTAPRTTTSGNVQTPLSKVRKSPKDYAVMTLKSFAAIGLIHVIIYIISAEWWVKHIKNGEVTVLQVVIVIAFWIIPTSIIKTERLLAYFLAILLGFAFVYVVFFKDHDTYVESELAKLADKDRKPSATLGQNVFARNTATTITPLTAATIGMEKNPCLEGKGLKGLDAERIRKALVGYLALLAIACRESGLNHREPNDSTKVLLGRQDPRDQGFLQINSFYHPPETVKKEVDCTDLTDFTCSERYGKKLYDKYGLNPWYLWGTKNESGRQYPPLTVLVTAGEEYGARINIPRLTRETRFDHPGHLVVIEAEAADGSKKEYLATHDVYVNMGHVVWVRVKRAPTERENVKLKITYAFQQCPIVN